MNHLKNIPVSRALLYILLIGLLPFVFVLVSFISQKNQLNELNNTLDAVQYEAMVKEKKQALNLSVKEHFTEADHFYIDKYLETLTFLDNEVEQLQKIVQDANFSDDDRIKKRLEFLTGPSNALVFSEGVVQAYPFFQETTETLVHPVEVNPTDIQKILARVEGIKIGQYEPGPNRPQLVITEFKLDKKKINDKSEVYLLNLKLLKREYL